MEVALPCERRFNMRAGDTNTILSLVSAVIFHYPSSPLSDIERCNLTTKDINMFLDGVLYCVMRMHSTRTCVDQHGQGITDEPRNLQWWASTEAGLTDMSYNIIFTILTTCYDI